MCFSFEKKKKDRNYGCPFITILYLPSPLPNQYSITFRHQVIKKKTKLCKYGIPYVRRHYKNEHFTMLYLTFPPLFLVPFISVIVLGAPKSILIKAIETDYTTTIKSCNMFMQDSSYHILIYIFLYQNLKKKK